jgi:hypothetical protein
MTLGETQELYQILKLPPVQTMGELRKQQKEFCDPAETSTTLSYQEAKDKYCTGEMTLGETQELSAILKLPMVTTYGEWSKQWREFCDKTDP